MQRYVFYAEAKCRAGIKNVKTETKDVVSVTKSGSSPRFGFNNYCGDYKTKRGIYFRKHLLMKSNS